MNRPICNSYIKALEVMKKRNWEHIYILVDLHGTVLNSNWSDSELPNEYYQDSVEVLKHLTNLKEVKLILWTSSHQRDYDIYISRLKELGVEFDFVNENPLEITQPDGYACFDKKFYFSVGFDDKFGFEPEYDWVALRTLLSA